MTITNPAVENPGEALEEHMQINETNSGKNTTKNDQGIDDQSFSKIDVRPQDAGNHSR